MFVLKRNNEREEVSFDKVLKRLRILSDGLQVNYYEVAQKVCSRIYDGVNTSELDELAAQMCSSLILDHPDYGTLASRIIISNHHKNTSPSFSETISILFNNVDKHGNNNPLISKELFDVVTKNKEKLNSYIDYNRDYNFDYFGFKTLERGYLMKVDGKVVERPQHMFLRVSLGIHGSDVKDALQTYDLMSQKYFVHATPTLFNSGTPIPQNSSCYLYGMEDSIDGIFKCLKDCAHISKYAGGIGIHIHNIRARNSVIRGTNGISTGIVPMLRVFNNTARYVNQCFTPDTIVYSELGPKYMKDVIEGERLITHDGSLKRVNTVCRKSIEQEKIKYIYTSVSDAPLKCTSVHEIGIWYNNELVFRAASDLKVGDLMFYPSSFHYTFHSNVDYDKLEKMKNNRGYLSTITNITDNEYTGDVYDFNMIDNHNYLTSHGIVHNSGRRNGSIAVYMEPWHADVEMFLEMRKNHGNEEERARDLFYALWIPDLFMKRVQENGMWSLMCPDTCRGLSDCYGDEFEKLYTKYERDGLYVKQMNAQDLWFQILSSQIETGTPYMLYKDHVNRKSNQKNIGIVKSSNLCTEIVEVSNHEFAAVCNLASLVLPSYVKDGVFDYDLLHTNTKILVKNLNKVIDRNFYPIVEAKNSNLRDRPIGLGVQGLADVFAILKKPFESEDARQINKDVFETIYHAAVEASMELATKFGPYATFEGSPASRGILQFDMWEVQPSSRYDWEKLKQDVKANGLFNSLLVAPMPTASTSQIMGSNEAFEPFTSNIYKRKTLAGEFILVNKYLVKELQEVGLWNHDIRTKIIVNDGSVQGINEIPQNIKDLYKTVWEIKMRSIIDMAADRGAFVDQSQSMNLFVENPDFKKLSSMHFYAWSKGLKTGMYYLRTKSKAKTQQFTIDPTHSKFTNLRGLEKNESHSDTVCESCSA